MNAYMELAVRHQQDVNAFPMFFAFTDKQFEEGMARFGLTPNDTDKIYSLRGTGGFICARTIHGSMKCLTDTLRSGKKLLKLTKKSTATLTKCSIVSL